MKEFKPKDRVALSDLGRRESGFAPTMTGTVKGVDKFGCVLVIVDSKAKRPRVVPFHRGFLKHA